MAERIKCLIIGSGPAGYTAAIYASRAKLDPVLYTGAEMGGQLMITTDVENYPGYPEGIMGPQMMDDFRNQAARFGTDIRMAMITKVDFSGPVHTKLGQKMVQKYMQIRLLSAQGLVPNG